MTNFMSMMYVQPPPLVHVLCKLLVQIHVLYMYNTLCSLLVWNNESINIWTHFIGFFYFTFLLLDDNFAFLPEQKAEFGDHLTFTCLTVCFQVQIILLYFVSSCVV